jgi:hypothetical protein
MKLRSVMLKIASQDRNSKVKDLTNVGMIPIFFDEGYY